MSMAGYTKLFSTILASTIWREDDKTRLVWITLLAMSDKNGVAEGSIPGLADLARVTLEECESALVKLMAPDKYSRTEEHEGRRIAKVDGGWSILNHAKYRAKMSADERREYNRIKQKEYRQRTTLTPCQQKSITVNDCKSQSALSAHTEAEADSKAVPTTLPRAKGAKKEPFTRPTQEEVYLEMARQEIRNPSAESQKFFAHFESNGWKVGGKAAMKDWKAAVVSWKHRNGSGPNGTNGAGASRTPVLPTAAEVRAAQLKVEAEQEARERAHQS